MVKMSLSPRPDMLITIAWSGRIRGASLKAWTKACADSMAGMMPSVRMARPSASITSRSVADAKRTRPRSPRSARMGETPT